MECDTKSQYIIRDEKTVIGNFNPSVKKSIKQITEKEGYIDCTIDKTDFSTDGDNFLGLLYEVNIKGKTEDGNKETNLFVKHVLSNCDNMTLLSISEVYNKEAYFYRELTKIFTRLQNEARVPPGEAFNLVKSYDESSVDAIILENMMKNGFKTYYRMDIMSLEFAELSIQQLARFHGLSFAIEKKMPQYFDIKLKSLKQSVAYNDTYREYAMKMYERMLKKCNPESKTKIDKCWNSLLDVYIKKCWYGTMTRVNCLCHGDYKMNNIIFKEINDEVVEVIPVDYQLIYYGSPIIDLIYFAFMGTDREFRRNHLTHLKDLYYDSLQTFLEYFEIHAEDVYPRKEYEEDFKKCLVVAIVNCIVIMPLTFVVNDERPDLTKEDLSDNELTLDDRFYDRIQGVVDDFIEWGYV